VAALRGAAGFIDKLLVDSSRSAPAAGGGIDALRTLQLLRESTAGAFMISDFSWRRGRVLREQSARAFDPGDMRPSLASLSGVRLFGGSPAEASLFFSWLQTRLDRDIRTDHAAEGPLGEGFRITFFIDGAPDLHIGCTKGGCLSRGEEKGGYRCPSDGEILREEVDTLARDPIFLEALARAGRLDA
jgi:glucose-6-phosphate dehydrogenase assembly protein OpcA